MKSLTLVVPLAALLIGCGHTPPAATGATMLSMPSRTATR